MIRNSEIPNPKSQIQTLCLILLMLMGVLVWLLSSGDMATAGTYTDSAHGTGVNRSSIDSQYSGFAAGNCAHCHEAHASLGGSEPLPNTDTAEYGHAGPDPAALFSYEEGVCETCHDGTPATDNIKAQIDKAYAHPTDDYSGRHSVSESTATDMDPTDYADGTSRHAECVDCHNPHAANSTVHTTGTNAVSSTSPLYKVSGIGVTNTGAWTAPSYTEILPSTGISYEYQLCFKCHSTWTTQPTEQTNIALQFNTLNESTHPVEAGLTASSSSALTAAQMSSPWNVAANMGVQTMYCSDCHGDDAAGSPPAGPHGSGSPTILKGRWPTNSSGYLWDLGDPEGNTNNFNTECLCKKCHPVYDTSWKNNAHSTGYHSRSYKCVQCHVGLPHGYKWGRLIADYNDSAPYDYDGYADVRSFNKASSPTGYTSSSSYCTVACSTPGKAH